MCILYVYMCMCTLGWVNLYQKFEIEKYTVCGKLILPKKKWKGIFFFLMYVLEKKLIFNVLFGVQTFHVLKTVQKCKKSLKTVKF